MVGLEKIYQMGIIGYGGMAGHHYAQTQKFGRIHVKGVYDINPDRIRFAEGQGLTGYVSKEALLADPEIDIVLVSTPNDSHKDLCIEALRAGKHVLCEKPVTITSAELAEIMKVAEETGKVFAIDQNRRTNKDFVLMKRCVEQGMLGDVYVIESRVEGSRGVPSGWRTNKEQGGGMMLDWGVHLIDQLLYMVDEKVVNVFCKMYSVAYPEVDDNFRLTLTFESGLTAHIEVSTNNYITHPRWYVLGKNGTLQIDSWDCSGKIVRCIDKENVWADEIVQTKAGPTKTMAPRNPESTETIALTEPLDVVDNLNPVYIQMLDAIEGKAPLTITPEQAMRVIRVMEASFESDRTAAAVQTSI